MKRSISERVKDNAVSIIRNSIISGIVGAFVFIVPIFVFDCPLFIVLMQISFFLATIGLSMILSTIIYAIFGNRFKK